MVKQISLRLPDELHELVKAAAERNLRSLHAEILWRLWQAEQSKDAFDRHESVSAAIREALRASLPPEEAASSGE
jgi:Arc/MetJ-type ribon-helix-helix transcriptional regulator